MLNKFKKNRLGMAALVVVGVFALLGLYAPFLASSKPFVVRWHGHWYFPFFRYLFFSGFYTKAIDLFYNIFMFICPILLLGSFLFYRFVSKKSAQWFAISCLIGQIALFILVISSFVKDPKADYSLFQKREEQLSKREFRQEDPLLAPFSLTPTWSFELAHMNPYQKLEILTRERLNKKQHDRLLPYLLYLKEKEGVALPTKWAITHNYEEEQITSLQKQIDEKRAEYSEAKELYSKIIVQYQPLSHAFIMAKHAVKEGRFSSLEEEVFSSEALSSIRSALESARFKIEKFLQLQSKLRFLQDKKAWIASEEKELSFMLASPWRSFHWEENAGGHSRANKYLPWYEVTRSNRKDLAAALLFGLRISFVVGITAVALSLFIGGTLGMIAGFFTGKVDLFICRWIEVWEAMPTFFMLLLIVAITQSKSIFLVISALGLFGWTGFARFMRAEVLKQRNLSYITAAKALGYGHVRIMRSEILPNAIAPILTLLPFSMMVAITSEAGLSFLGLGEEGSASLGVLMDEGRHAFPGESYLLWPAAIALTLLLVAMALVGDALRDSLDPKTTI